MSKFLVIFFLASIIAVALSSKTFNFNSKIYSFDLTEKIKQYQTSNQINYTLTKINTTIQNQSITGNFIKIYNPASQVFSVEIPQGTCSNMSVTKYTSDYHSCQIATNAGFFDMQTGACIGNVVSNGVAIQTNDTDARVNFGILKNGSFFVGYLNKSKLNTLEFQQLISGAGWLVHEGKNYVSTSAPIEGISAGFVSEIAPRNVIGFDQEGNMQILEINGYEDLDQGIGLVALADLAVSYNFQEAMNTDGGGSTTVIVNDEVQNTCSDTCEKGYNDQFQCKSPSGISTAVCERKVTTITCFKTQSSSSNLKEHFTKNIFSSFLNKYI